MPSDDVLTRNGDGDLSVRVVNSTGDNYVDPNDAYTRDNDGNLAVRVVGAGGGGGAVDSVNGQTGVVVLTEADLVTDVTISSATATQELEDSHIYNCGEMTSLEITLPNNTDVKYASQINFTSGSTPTSFTSPVGMVWLGDDVSTTFIPTANKRYAIMVFNDGTAIRGIVQATEI